MRALWGLLALTACFDPRIAPGGACTDVCPGGLVCVEGNCMVAGTPTPDAATPDAACVAACAGDDLVCGASSESCVLGCTDADGARCRMLVPSNGVDWVLAGSATLAITGSVRLDSGTGEIRDETTAGQLRPPGEGTIGGITYTVVDGIAVVGVHELSVAEGATLRLEGSNPLVLLVAGDATIDGLVDASGGCANDASCAGPGGGRGGRAQADPAGAGAGATGTVAGNGHGNGGGGGGFGQAGAVSAGNTAAGVTYGNTTLVPLRAGSGGGYGGTASNGGVGGGGGGGVQLTAGGTITINTGGAIDAGGGGGGGELAFDTGGGGGGGSGGGILLEAIAIAIHGSVTANGGGGGGHTMMPLSAGRGEDGRRATAAAMGAPGDWGGGNGGTGTLVATPGRVLGDHGGGGGGGAGRIRINAVTRETAGTISPSPTLGTVVGD